MAPAKRRALLQKMFEERRTFLNALAIARGCTHIWDADQQVACDDNRETDEHLLEGNHPILDEWLAVAEAGNALLRIGAYV